MYHYFIKKIDNLCSIKHKSYKIIITSNEIHKKKCRTKTINFKKIKY